MEVAGRGKEAGMAAWREGDREKGIVDGGKEVGPAERKQEGDRPGWGGIKGGREVGREWREGGRDVKRDAG